MRNWFWNPNWSTSPEGLASAKGVLSNNSTKRLSIKWFKLNCQVKFAKVPSWSGPHLLVPSELEVINFVIHLFCSTFESIFYDLHITSRWLLRLKCSWQTEEIWSVWSNVISRLLQRETQSWSLKPSKVTKEQFDVPSCNHYHDLDTWLISESYNRKSMSPWPTDVRQMVRYQALISFGNYSPLLPVNFLYFLCLKTVVLCFFQDTTFNIAFKMLKMFVDI